MLILHASQVDVQTAKENNFQCAVVDYAAVKAAEANTEEPFEGCTIQAEYAVALQPAEDMTIPIFLCKLHYNSLRIGLNEGVAIAEDMLGDL